MSLVRPEMPSRPDRLFSVEKISSRPLPSLCIRYSMTVGSMSPQRVPIISPSSGVMPIDVSIDLPPLMAHAEQPLPRWSVMMFVSSRVLPVSFR